MIVRCGVAITIFPRFRGVVDSRFVAVIRRGKAPLAGRWSLPGGRLEVGESLADGAAREAFEELAIRVDVQPAAANGVTAFTSSDAIHLSEGFHYVVSHVLGFVDCVIEGELPVLHAGDDAAAAMWVRVDDDDGAAVDSDYPKSALTPTPTLASTTAGPQVSSVVTLARRLLQRRGRSSASA